MNLSMQSEKITKFVLSLFDADRPAPAPDRVIVRHLSVSDRQSDVGTLAMPAEPGEDGAALVPVADRIREMIETDAEGLGGLQRYVLLGMHGSDVVGRLPLRVAGAAEESEGDAFDSEPATARGLVSQLMRHNEANSRIVSMSMAQLVSTMGRQMDRMRILAEEAEDKRHNLTELAEELFSGKHVRDLETRALELRAETIQKGLATLFPLVAELLKSTDFSGLKGLGGVVAQAAASVFRDAKAAPAASADADAAAEEDAPCRRTPAAPDAGVGAFLKNLTLDQQIKIFSVLSPEQQAALSALAAQFGGAGSDAGVEGQGSPADATAPG